MTQPRLHDKITIITGGASGLGLATARLFVAEGARVVVADLDTPAARDALGDLDATFRPTDVSDARAVDTLVADTVAEYGRLDAMFNNAGIVRMAPILETSPEDARLLMDVNFGGAFNGLRTAGRVMTAQGYGSIINTASNGGSSPTAGLAAYCATKAAIIALSKASAIELAPHGVRVNTLSPGTMLSGMVADDPALRAHLDTLQPVGYAADPALMAHGAVFLASDESIYMTGHDLVIDGGATAGRGGANQVSHTP